MKKLSKGIVKGRFVILLMALLLLIPSAIGYFNTRINYDVLTYLPKEIETMKGQQILLDEFGVGSFSMYMVEGMEEKDVSKLKSEIEGVDHVKDVLWYDSFMDLSIPMEMLPADIYEAFNNADTDTTMMFIMYDTGISADETMDAVGKIRELSNEQCFLSGMSAIVTDTRDLSNKETPIYVAIAVALSVVVLSITMDSFLIPLFFLLSIGMSIIYNLGTNIFLGEISYITQALTAVLQLGVTMDYSIFLWHSYSEKKLECDDKKEAMAQAISATFSSVVASSTTTVAGFVALCFMSFTLGLDLGVVMAKGVVIGVICCVTILPAMILIFDKGIEKTKHKPLMPRFDRISAFITRHYIIIAILFVIIWIPAIWGYTHTGVYYNLDSSLPKTLQSVQANEKLDNDFAMGASHIILMDKNLDNKYKVAIMDEAKEVEGVKNVLGIEAFTGSSLPQSMIPDKAKEMLESGDWEMVMIMSEYPVASDEVNKQCDEINAIIDKYDDKAMLIGEAPCTKDLIQITDIDFNTVSTVSIGIIFLIIALVFKSISLPVILVGVIEFAIFINMGIPGFTGTKLPFIASIVIGTIQLGSTVDYAILMTTRYKNERYSGKDKKEAITIAHGSSIQSVIVSALSFFAATFGVGTYSDIDMISSLCILMARGALISMVTVIFVLPSVLMIFDPLIIRTSIGFRPKKVTNLK
ncbi:MAG: MMPL family transporter [Lachnospiraceae bacterium]|nr:MMPL family transporter [Candidatus Colinaster scatohippi]